MANHTNNQSISPNQLIMCDTDLVFANDITGPVAIDEFKKLGKTQVFDKNKVALVPDHFTPNKDIAAAGLAQKTRTFAKEMDITHYFEVGRVGIEHVLLPEKGLISPGYVVVGADSHTCTHGALGAFSTGIGSTDMAFAMATGQLWFKVPEAIAFKFSGNLQPFVTGKDVILHIIGMIGVDGARYQSMEFIGDLFGLSMDDRFTIANMAVEAGAKNGIFMVDEQTQAYLKEHGANSGTVVVPDEGAYSKIYEINLSEVPLTVAYPHLPENTRDIDQAIKDKIKIDQVVIGSCTNGRIEDMREAAEILKGNHIAEGVRCIIIPATQKVWKECVQEGLMEIFIDAGAAVSTPTCGPCLGGHMGILAEGERCVSTTNRNFVGRMGHVKSEVYLASPYVAAASGIKGYIESPKNIKGDA